MITCLSLTAWAKNLMWENGVLLWLLKPQLKISRLCYLLLMLYGSHIWDQDIGRNFKTTSNSILKAHHLPLMKSISRKISWVMLRRSQTHAKLPRSNIRLKAPLKRSRNNGRVFKCRLMSIRKLTKLKAHNPSSQFCKNTWAHYLTRKQASSMTISKIKSKDGKTTFKKYPKLCKCWFKFKDNGSIYRPFLPHNKNNKDNFRAIFVNSKSSTVEFQPICKESIVKNISSLFF